MTENRAELILALRDEISKGLGPVNAALAQTKQQIADLGGGSKTAAAGLDEVAKSGTGVGNALAMAHGKALAMAGQLAALVGISISVGAGLAFIKKNIDAISDTSLKSIAGAAMMVSRETIDGVEAQKAAYGEYRAYILSMYKEINAETQNHFASGKEMQGTFNALVQMGIYASKDEAKSIGVITDAVKLLHGGYVDQVMVQHEIRGLLEGHAGMHYKLAQQLSTMIGPEWKKIVRDQVEAGTFLTFLEEKYKGLAVASGDIQKVLTAQQTTLDTLISQVGKAGLAGMYEDIVSWVVQINQYLREHRDEIANKIASTWEGMRESVYGVATGIGSMTRAIAEFGGQLDNISRNPAFMALFGAAAGSRLGPWGAVAGGGAGFAYAMQQRNYDEVARGLERAKREQSGLIGYGSEGEGDVTPPVDITPPKWKPALGVVKGGGGKGGGKGEEAAENSLENFVSRMKQETAKAAGEGMAALDAWYGKESQTLDRLAAKGLATKTAKEAMDTAYWSKADKLSDGFYQVMAKESGNAYVEIDNQAQQWLTKFQGIKDKEGNIIDVAGQAAEVKARKTWELDVKNYTERLGLEKGYYDQAAQLSPVLSDQINFKRKALELDIEEKRYAEALKLNKLELAGIITRSQADEYRGRQALLDQQQRFNFEMENDKGLSGWAYARVKSENQKNTWADAMEGLESFVNDAWTQGVQGALSKTKVDYMEVAKTMAVSFMLNLGKQGIHKLFTGVAEAIVGAGQLGTENNPMVVKIKGLGLPEIGKGAGITPAPDFAMRASKIGYSTGGNESWADQTKKLSTYDKLLDKMYKDERKDLGGISSLKKQMAGEDKRNATAYSDMQDEMINNNQELFKAEYLEDYQTHFRGMVTDITGVWQVGQGLMTAAGVSGETQRIASMAAFGLQGISILTSIAKSAIIVEAWQSAAAAYKSAMVALPFPINAIVAPIFAAATFAAVAAMGAFGGGIGGGGGGSPGLLDSQMPRICRPRCHSTAAASSMPMMAGRR